MATFNYKARDKKGALKQGSVEAASKKQVFDLLRKYDLNVFSVTEKTKNDILSHLSFLKGVSLKSKVIFFRQLSTMITAGLSIIQALKIMREQEKLKNKKFADIIGSVAGEIEGGLSFSASLAKFPDVFPSIYINLIKSGEASGKLDEVLNRLATQLEKDYDLKSKVRGAMMYPIFIVCAMGVVIVIIVTFIMPQLKTLFQESNVELPLMTKILLGSSDIARNFWWLIIPGIAGFIFSIWRFIRTKVGRGLWDRMKLKIPIISKFVQNIYMARFTRTLSTLIASGLPILDSLNIVADTIGNVHYKKEIDNVADQVENGVNIADPLEDSKLFPTMVSHMIEVGEKTGNIDEILSKLADFFDNEVNNTVAVFSTMLEPLILLLMGAGVGVLVAAVLLPIYKLATVI